MARHRVLTGLVVLLGLLPLAGYSYVVWSDYQEQLQIKREQAQFAQAEKDVQRVTTAIIAAAGQPLKAEDDKSCFMPSVKFTERTISCSVTSDLFYEVQDETEATRIHQAAVNQAASTWKYERDRITEGYSKEDGFEKISNRTSLTVPNLSKVLSEFDTPLSSIGCSLLSTLYATDHPPYEEYFIESISPYTLLINVRCNDSTHKPYYRIRE